MCVDDVCTCTCILCGSTDIYKMVTYSQMPCIACLYICLMYNPILLMTYMIAGPACSIVLMHVHVMIIVYIYTDVDDDVYIVMLYACAHVYIGSAEEAQASTEAEGRTPEVRSEQGREGTGC